MQRQTPIFPTTLGGEVFHGGGELREHTETAMATLRMALARQLERKFRQRRKDAER